MSWTRKNKPSRALRARLPEARPTLPEVGRVDLHMHTNRSDGRHPPEEVLARCAAARLDVVAITDHDLPGPFSAGVHEVGGRSVRVIAGTELSGTHGGRELHLLVYFPGEMPESFAEFLRSRARERAERYDRGLDALGLDAARADTGARAGDRALTRHHIYRALRDAGRAPEPHAAWSLIHARVPLLSLTFVEAIRVARAAGGLTVWAHPQLADATAWIDVFVAAGLHGVELLRPTVDRRVRNGLKTLADKHRLVASGGSDWHGWSEGELGAFAFQGERAAQFLARLDA